MNPEPKQSRPHCPASKRQFSIGPVAACLIGAAILLVGPQPKAAVNPDMPAYLRDNSAIFKRLFPTAEIRKLAETQGVYTCYFKVSRADLYTADMGNQTKCADYGLQGVFVDNRLVAILSMYGLECGWPQTPQRTPGCMKLILNLYIHALTAGPER